MKVILQQDVKGQGKKGQMIDVSDGYARNFLLPRKLAVVASADNLNVMKQQEKAKAEQAAREKQTAQDAAKKLESVVVKIPARAGSAGKLFGSVTSKEIAEALLEQHGIEIEKNRIIQTDPIKTFGSFEIKCRLGHEVSGTIHLIVTEAK